MDPASARFHKSNLQRYWMYKSALKIFCDYPITGVGQRNFSRVYATYVPEELRDPRTLRDDGRVYIGFAHAHSLYLNLMATQGMLGLAAFLWLIAAGVRLAWRNYRTHDDALLRTVSLGVLTAMVAFLALGTIDENSRDSESIMQLWFLMGITMAIHRMPPTASRPVSSSAGPDAGITDSQPANV
jgi:O-antigen ligase